LDFISPATEGKEVGRWLAGTAMPPYWIKRKILKTWLTIEKIHFFDPKSA